MRNLFRLRNLLATLALAPLLLAGCIDNRSYGQAICVLIDVSGTYADQRSDVVKVVKREVLPHMIPGDTLIAILIDSESYQKENVKALATLDPRPSQANAQKLALAKQLDAFALADVRSKFTDIPGAMMLAAEYLQEAESGSRVMLVFSDLREELPSGSRRSLRDDEFAGIEVVAMNVKRLEADSADPETYRKRLEGWRKRVERAGGDGWRTVLDTSKLPGILAEIRS
jgi:hypothetical protein